MRKPDYPDTILDQDTINKLLKALQVGMIDMAYFPGLYFRTCGQIVDPDLVSKQEARQFNTIRAKIKRDTAGQVVLNRGLKIRLLNAIRVRRIDLHADFAELAFAYRAVKQDWSAITEEEKQFFLTICRRINK
ncbi:hypothetical protein [Spirosoma endophyticum]|uniref:Uncharacterized protein n=1 Tax=Spirosoma endophyticum TaxID=662367 RepID=A0A1I2GWG0_9BACT|nr:hypothetical protein [Spirosoma endophyticum]SFF22045.1 hypothetical protein SAMN05216167_13621 [Spirosoma endophyticum]